MQRKGISQREARWLQKRVKELERQWELTMRTWGAEYSGIHIDTITVNDIESAIIRTALGLKHPVVLRPTSENRQFYVYAVRP